MKRVGRISTTLIVVGVYLGFTIAAGTGIGAVTVAAGFNLHTLVAPQISGTTWTASIVTLVGLAKAVLSIGIVLLTLYTTCRVVSTISDSLFAQALHAPDGRKLTGVFGLLATCILAALWALPLWDSLLPQLAATGVETAPATLPGNTKTFVTTVPVIGALFGYFAITGGDYSVPDTTGYTTESDSPSYSKPATPTTPRTTKIATLPERNRRTQQQATDTGGDTQNTLDTDSDETPADDTDSNGSEPPSNNSEIDEPQSGHSDSSNQTTGSPDYHAEFERHIQEAAATDDTETTTQTTKGSVDLGEYQFDWLSETNVTMRDVGGMDEVKTEIRQDIIRPMRDDPEKAEKFDIPLPNILLYGPPGTGKTYLAKALATELGFPFVDLSGSDITSKWVNESHEKVGQLFEEAEDIAGSVGGAVIFLDELDAILPERQMDSHGEDRKVVNEFLSHLQESARNHVLFVGATNKRDDLDSAATRSGRIDKEIFVGEPDHEARVAIFKAQLEGRPHALDDEDINRLAKVTDDVVAADIEAIVNQAARNTAYGRDAEQIEMDDIELQINK